MYPLKRKLGKFTLLEYKIQLRGLTAILENSNGILHGFQGVIFEVVAFLRLNSIVSVPVSSSTRQNIFVGSLAI